MPPPAGRDAQPDAPRGSITLSVTWPAGGAPVAPGQSVLVQDQAGRRFRTVLPQGIRPGQSFRVEVPRPAPSKSSGGPSGAAGAAARIGEPARASSTTHSPTRSKTWEDVAVE